MFAKILAIILLVELGTTCIIIYQDQYLVRYFYSLNRKPTSTLVALFPLTIGSTTLIEFLYICFSILFPPRSSCPYPCPVTLDISYGLLRFVVVFGVKQFIIAVIQYYITGVLLNGNKKSIPEKDVTASQDIYHPRRRETDTK